MGLYSSTPVREVVPIFEKALAEENKRLHIKIFPKRTTYPARRNRQRRKLLRLKRFADGYLRDHDGLVAKTCERAATVKRGAFSVGAPKILLDCVRGRALMAHAG